MGHLLNRLFLFSYPCTSVWIEGWRNRQDRFKTTEFKRRPEQKKKLQRIMSVISYGSLRGQAAPERDVRYEVPEDRFEACRAALKKMGVRLKSGSWH